MITDRINNLLSLKDISTPYLVMDLEIVRQNYLNLATALPETKIYYAVKANPHPEILQLLVRLNSCFDCASITEIEQCLKAGAKPEQISFGNTIKKAKDIARAYLLGIRIFAFDSIQELEKIAVHAPGATVYCRIFVECDGAEYALSKKFGCDPDYAIEALVYAVNLGLKPEGISFHVGSQQLNISQWDKAIATTADIFRELAQVGIDLELVNLGGGFPVRYDRSIPEANLYTTAIQSSLRKHFGAKQPRTMIEPGRSLVGNAGTIEAEIVLISRRPHIDERRWVFLDIGKFGGLIETDGEIIKYEICTPGDGMATGPVVLAGPTCDSSDILYDKSNYHLPLNLSMGDRVKFSNTGAYTSTYSSIEFNGFSPLQVYCI
jgi:ornithine decarboxylase